MTTCYNILARTYNVIDNDSVNNAFSYFKKMVILKAIESKFKASYENQNNFHNKYSNFA